MIVNILKNFISICLKKEALPEKKKYWRPCPPLHEDYEVPKELLKWADGITEEIKNNEPLAKNADYKIKRKVHRLIDDNPWLVNKIGQLNESYLLKNFVRAELAKIIMKGYRLNNKRFGFIKRFFYQNAVYSVVKDVEEYRFNAADISRAINGNLSMFSMASKMRRNATMAIVLLFIPILGYQSTFYSGKLHLALFKLSDPVMATQISLDKKRLDSTTISKNKTVILSSTSNRIKGDDGVGIFVLNECAKHTLRYSMVLAKMLCDTKRNYVENASLLLGGGQFLGRNVDEIERVIEGRVSEEELAYSREYIESIVQVAQNAGGRQKLNADLPFLISAVGPSYFFVILMGAVVLAVLLYRVIHVRRKRLFNISDLFFSIGFLVFTVVVFFGLENALLKGDVASMAFGLIGPSPSISMLFTTMLAVASVLFFVSSFYPKLHQFIFTQHASAFEAEYALSKKVVVIVIALLGMGSSFRSMDLGSIPVHSMGAVAIIKDYQVHVLSLIRDSTIGIFDLLSTEQAQVTLKISIAILMSSILLQLTTMSAHYGEYIRWPLVELHELSVVLFVVLTGMTRIVNSITPSGVSLVVFIIELYLATVLVAMSVGVLKKYGLSELKLSLLSFPLAAGLYLYIG